MSKLNLKHLVKKSASEPVALMRLIVVDKPLDVTSTVPQEDLWVEEKYDGWLVQIIIGNDVHIYSRRGTDVTENFPTIVEGIRKAQVPTNSHIIGELVWFTPEGKQDVGRIQSLAKSSPEKAQQLYQEFEGTPRIIIFGAIELAGKDVSEVPYKDLKHTLETTIKENDAVAVVKSYPFDKWEEVMDKAIAEGGEGIVLKNITKGYKFAPKGEHEPKPKGYWYKYKGGAGKHGTDDFVVYNVERTEAGSLVLDFGQYYKNDLYGVGRIDSFGREEEPEILDAAKHLPFVIEIGFQERTASGKLRHQRFIRLRPDKSPKNVVIEHKDWVEHLKKVAAIKRNPEEIVIQPNEFYPQGLSKQNIYDYYNTPKIKDALLNQFQGKDIFTVIKTDGEIYKRKENGTNIRINNKQEFEKYNTGRTVEFHITLGETAPYLFVDLDPREHYPFADVKQVANDIVKLMSNIQNVTKTEVRFSGNRGFHIYGHLSSPINVDKGRELMKEKLQEYIDTSGNTLLSVGTTNDPKSMRLDTSTFHKTGSLRALYSLHKNTGLACIPVSDINTFEKDRAKIDRVTKSASRLNMKKTADFDGGTFVVQKHEAKKAGLHFDLRLEWPEGSLETYKEKRQTETNEPFDTPGNLVLRSWAVRKLPALLSGEQNKVLAVPTEDHPLSYKDFEGEIPEGSYGAGKITTFDSGTYDLVEATDKKIIADFHGQKLNGRFNLVKTGTNWLLIQGKKEAKRAMVVNVFSKGKFVASVNVPTKDRADAISQAKTVVQSQYPNADMNDLSFGFKKSSALNMKKAWDNGNYDQDHYPGSNTAGPVPYEIPKNPSSRPRRDQRTKEDYHAPSQIDRDNIPGESQPEQGTTWEAHSGDPNKIDNVYPEPMNWLRPFKGIQFTDENILHDFNVGFDTPYTQRQRGLNFRKRKKFALHAPKWTDPEFLGSSLYDFVKHVLDMYKGRIQEDPAFEGKLIDSAIPYYIKNNAELLIATGVTLPIMLEAIKDAANRLLKEDVTFDAFPAEQKAAELLPDPRQQVSEIPQMTQGEARLLDELTSDQIWDIARNPESENTPEGQAARALIEKGIVASRLNLKKLSFDYVNAEISRIVSQWLEIARDAGVEPVLEIFSNRETAYNTILRELGPNFSKEDAITIAKTVVDEVLTALQSQGKLNMKKQAEEVPENEFGFENMNFNEDEAEDEDDYDKDYDEAEDEDIGEEEKDFEEYHNQISQITDPNELAQLVADAKNFSRPDLAKYMVALNPNTSPDTLAQLSTDPSMPVREAVANNQNTYPDTLAILATDESMRVKRYVAGNPNAYPDTLAILATDESEDVRYRVALNPNTHPDTFAQLATNESLEFKIRVAGDPYTPPNTLAILSTDESEEVRVSVASNPSTSPDTLAQLSTDEAEDVKYWVAKNLSTHPNTLVQLSTDESELVRTTVANNPNTPPEIATKLRRELEKAPKGLIYKQNPSLSKQTEKAYQRFLKFWNDNTNPFTQKIKQQINNGKLPKSSLIKYLKQIGIAPNQVENILNKIANTSIKLNMKKQAEEVPENEFGFENMDFTENEDEDEDEDEDDVEDYNEDKFYEDKEILERLRIARDPNTPPDTLAQLATDEIMWVRYRVAGNPNTPPDILAQLATDWRSDVRAMVAGNPNTPKDALAILATDKRLDIRLMVANNQNTHPDTLAILSTDESEEVRASVAGNPNTPKDTLAQLSTDESEKIKISVAGNPSTSPDTLAILATDESKEVRANVASNSSTYPDTLAQLATDESEYVKSFVAGNPNTPPGALAQLSTDESENVRTWVEENPNTPPEIVEKLKRELEPGTKGLIYTQKPSLSQQTEKAYQRFLQFWNDNTNPFTQKIKQQINNGKLPKSSLIKYLKQIGISPNQVDNILNKIANTSIKLNMKKQAEGVPPENEFGFENMDFTENEDEDEGAYEDADKDFEEYNNRISKITDPNELTQLFNNAENSPSPEVLKAFLADNPNTPPDTLAQLSTNEFARVKAMVAGNPNTSPDTLAQLATDESEDVRYRVAGNPNTHPDTLAQLSTDESEDVRIRVAQNPSTSPDTLAQLSTDESEDVRHRVAGNPNTHPDTLAQLSTDESAWVKAIVAGNPNTPPNALAQLSTDESEDVRRNVAGNPNTPLEIAEKLRREKPKGPETIYTQKPSLSKQTEKAYQRFLKFWNDDTNPFTQKIKQQINNGKLPKASLIKYLKQIGISPNQVDNILNKIANTSIKLNMRKLSSRLTLRKV